MESLAPYLDELKKLKGLEKDVDLARFLKVSRAYISQLRGGMYMGEVKCFEVAEMLKREPLELLSLNQVLRNTERKVCNYWYEVHLQTKIKKNSSPD